MLILIRKTSPQFLNPSPNSQNSTAMANSIRRVRFMYCKILIASLAITLITACSNQNVQYTANSSGHLHRVGTVTSVEVFKNKVVREAGFEAAGLRPPVGSRTWRDYWLKVVAYWPGADQFGTHQKVVAYIAQERRARGLPPL
jgi:hypothetical protein